jgi:hypothetical protein
MNKRLIILFLLLSASAMAQDSLYVTKDLTVGFGSGTGTGIRAGNYQLSGRKTLSQSKPLNNCNEEGTVVVTVSVDRSGKVISATAGARGTTNPASCLLTQAKAAALQTKFDSSNDAPEKQVGKIVYNFKLTD